MNWPTFIAISVVTIYILILILPYGPNSKRHHPEHFKNGIRDMNLIDVLEMSCDGEIIMDECRMKFEEWASKQTPPNFSMMPWPKGFMREDGLYDGPTLINGEYFSSQTQAAWIGFQAAWSLLRLK